MKKAPILFKSSMRETFENKLSLILVILFFVLTFGIIYGNISANIRFRDGIYETSISNNLYHSTLDTESVNIKRNPQGQILPEIFQTIYDDESITSPLSDEEAISLINLKEGGSESSNWWETNKNQYASDLDTFLLLKLLQATSDDIGISYSYQQSFTQKNSIPGLGYESSNLVIRLNDENYSGVNYLDNNFQKTIFNENETKNEIVNQFEIIEGKLPETNSEIALNYSFAKANELNVGDQYQSKLITGLVRIPNFITPIFSKTDIEINYQTHAIILVPFDSFIQSQISYRPISDFSSNVYIFFNDIYKQITSYKTFVDASTQISDKTKEFNNFLLHYFDIDKSYSYSQIAFPWFDKNFPINLRVQSAFSRSEFINSFNIILIFIFISIFFIIFYLNIKKKIYSSAKQIGTMKAIGLSTNKISLMYLFYPIIIVLIGSIFAFSFGILIHNIWQFYSIAYFDLTYGPIPFNLVTTFFIVIMPLFVFTLVSFIITKIILRKSALSLISNQTNSKPNIFVRTTSNILKNVNFPTAYTIKNGLRSASKSMLIVIALFFSLFLMLLSFSMIGMVEKTVSGIYESIDYSLATTLKSSENEVFYLDESQITESTLYNYIIINTSPKKIDLVNPSALKDDFSTQVLNNLISNPIYTVDENGDLVNFGQIGNEQMKILLSWNVVFNKNGISNFNLADSILDSSSQLKQFKSINYLDILNIEKMYIFKTIYTFNSLYPISNISSEEVTQYIDEYMLIFDETKLSFNTFVYKSKFDTFGYELSLRSNNESLGNLIMFDTIDELELNYNLINKSNQNLISELSKINPNENYVPIIISEYTYEKFNEEFNDEDYIDVKINLQNFNYSLNSSINFEEIGINFKVIGVYESYFPIGIFSTVPYIEYYIESNYPQINFLSFDKSIRYSNNIDGQKPPINMSATIISDVTYSSKFDSVNNQTNYFLLDANNPLNPYTQSLHYLDSLIGTSYSEEIVTKSFEKISQSINTAIYIFASLAFIIGIMLVFILLKEIIDSSKLEISLLKVLGYTSIKSTFYILIPYLFIIIMVFFISIPISLFALTMVQVFLRASTGIMMPLYPLPKQILLSGVVIFSIILLIMFVAYIIYRNTSPLDALK